MKQLTFSNSKDEFLPDKNFFKGFGGSLLKGSNPTGKRPVSSRHAIHVVLKSSIAKGEKSMRHPNHRKKIENIILQQAENWGMRLYKRANAGNHLHLLLRPKSKRRFTGFLRSISGLISRQVLGAERGRAKGLKFWQSRPFTRVVKWGDAFHNAKNYVKLNAKEALGFLSLRKLKKLGARQYDLEIYRLVHGSSG